MYKFLTWGDWVMDKLIISPRINLLKSELKNNISNDKILENFWSELEKSGTPIVEEISEASDTVLVTFLYKGTEDTKNVVVLSDLSKFNYKTSQIEQILGTNIWYKTYEIRNDVRFLYNFSVNDLLDDDMDKRFSNLTYDLLNPAKFIFPKYDEDPEDIERVSSLVELPYTDKFYWSIQNNTSQKGTVEVHKFHSELLNNERRIWMYTPHGHSKDVAPYGAVVVTDGFQYINMLSAPVVLHNLISEGKIPSMVGIFIDTVKDRRAELTCNKSFSDFVAKEVMPWALKNYNITNEPNKNVIAGFSLGGLTASFIGLTHSEVFGNVLSQSGSYWWSPKDEDKFNWMSRQYEAVENLSLKFYLNTGVLETPDRIIETNENFRDTLKSKGYSVHYETFKSAHNYIYWGETLANGLIALVGIS